MTYKPEKCNPNYTLLGDPIEITKKCVVCLEEFVCPVNSNQITCDEICYRHYNSAWDEYEDLQEDE